MSTRAGIWELPFDLIRMLEIPVAVFHVAAIALTLRSTLQGQLNAVECLSDHGTKCPLKKAWSKVLD